MIRRLFGLLVVPAVIGVFSWGCSRSAPQAGETRTVSEVIDDASITAAVKVSLAFQSGVRAIGVDVDTRQGTVTLSGEVGSEAERQLAVKVAEDVGGVKEVVNHLEIQG